MGQPRERVGLVHELRELAGAEELLDRSDDRADIDQRLRCDRFDVLRGHTFADHSLHPRQARTDLVLDELADGAKTTVAEMVDVVGLDDDFAARPLNGRHVCVQTQDVLDRRENVIEGQDALIQRQVEAELPVDLVPTHLREVVPLGVEIEVVNQIASVLQRGRLTRPQLAVDVQQRIVLALDGVLLQRCHEDLVLTESFANLFGGHAQGLE